MFRPTFSSSASTEPLSLSAHTVLHASVQGLTHCHLQPKSLVVHHEFIYLLRYERHVPGVSALGKAQAVRKAYAHPSSPAHRHHEQEYLGDAWRTPCRRA